MSTVGTLTKSVHWKPCNENQCNGRHTIWSQNRWTTLCNKTPMHRELHSWKLLKSERDNQNTCWNDIFALDQNANIFLLTFALIIIIVVKQSEKVRNVALSLSLYLSEDNFQRPTLFYMYESKAFPCSFSSVRFGNRFDCKWQKVDFICM